MEQAGKCDVCQNPAKQRCGGCHNVFYCSKEHQKAGWNEHKKTCRPFKVCDDEIVGRYLQATKDIKEGDVIFQEEPLIWGPLQMTIPVCMGCGNAVNSKNCIPCSKCGWPLCSKKCEHSLNHIPECHYTVKKEEKISFSTFDIPHPSYQCITTLRCLYQKRFAPDVWEKLNKLESHHEEREKAGKNYDDKMYVVKFIHEFFDLKDEFSEEEILRICGIINVNAHEVPLSTPHHVAIFQQSSMLEHRCRSNCYKTFTPQGKLLLIAGMPIQKGDHLSICYTDAFWTTFTRRKHLMETKFFLCACDRCADVTEFGTYYSALKCQKEKCDGLLLPGTFLEEGFPWTCAKCKNELSAETVDKIMKHIGEDLHAMKKGSIEPVKKFLEYYAKQLPPNHFYMTDVKLALIQLIGYAVKTNENVSHDDLDLEIKLCRELIALVRTIAPGEKRVQGSILFELHTAIAEMGRRKANTGLIGPGDLALIIMDSKRFLEEAAECLKHEPSILPEGQLHLQAKENMEKLEVLLRTLAQNADNGP